MLAVRSKDVEFGTETGFSRVVEYLVVAVAVATVRTDARAAVQVVARVAVCAVLQAAVHAAVQAFVRVVLQAAVCDRPVE